MVATVAKVGKLESARNSLVNFGKFVFSGTDAPYKVLALGSGACSVAAIMATFAANNDMDPDAETNKFTEFFSPLFSKATTGSFAGQFLQSLFGFASPASALAYGALTWLNEEFNGKPREIGVRIAAQIRAQRKILKALKQKLQATFDKVEQGKIRAAQNYCKEVIDQLLSQLEEIKAANTLGTNVTLAIIGATFLRPMSILSPQASTDPSIPFPNKAHKISIEENREVTIHDWWNSLLANGKKELQSIIDLPKSFNPSNWTGTFFGKNKELSKSLEAGYYTVKPHAPVSSDEKKISLLGKNGKLDNLKTLIMTFGSSKAPYLLHGITSFSRLTGLGIISYVLLTKGYDFVKSKFLPTNTHTDNSIDNACVNSSTFLIKNVAVPVSAFANMFSGTSTLNMAVYGSLSTACSFWGGSAYMASVALPSMSSMLQLTGTMGLLIGNCAAVLKVPAAKFLKEEGLDNFSDYKKGLTANNILKFQRSKVAVVK